jgi:tellurite resistance protein TerC
MLHATALGWAFTVALIAALLVLDWLLLGRRPRALGFGEAAAWSVFYLAVAVLFGVGFGLVSGWGVSAQYFAGFVVEKSLSVDNLFVLVIIIGAFSVPDGLQPKALTIGITVALALRTVFIALGAALLASFSFMFLIFGLMLIATAVQLYRHRDQDPSVEDNAIVALARRVLPLSSSYDGTRLVSRDGERRVFTPLLLVLIAIGTTDVLFAFDSIPAVFGVTRHTYIVFAANAFAMLGLRPLFFLVSELLSRLVYLSTGLAVILAFIGVKLVLEFIHQHDHSAPEISTGWSLAVVALTMGTTAVASLLKAKRDPRLRAHAGALRERRPQQAS